MSVLYLLSPGSSVRKEGGRLVVEKDGDLVARVPLRMVTSVVVGASAGATIPALFACMEEAVPIFFVDGRSNVVGQLAGENITLRMLRYQLAYSVGVASVLRVILSMRSSTTAMRFWNGRYGLHSSGMGWMCASDSFMRRMGGARVLSLI